MEQIDGHIWKMGDHVEAILKPKGGHITFWFSIPLINIVLNTYINFISIPHWIQFGNWFNGIWTQATDCGKVHHTTLFLVTMSIYWFGLRSMVSLGLQMDYRTELYSDSISFDLTRQLCWHSYIDNHSDTMLSTSANLITKHFSHHFIVIKCKWSCELLWEGDCHRHAVNSVFLH